MEESKYEMRVVAGVVVPSGEPLFSELTTVAAIVDEFGGGFVEVRQHGRNGLGKIAIEPREWAALRLAIDKMVDDCKS